MRKLFANRIVLFLRISGIAMGFLIAAPVMGAESAKLGGYEYCTLLPGITSGSIGKFLEEFKSLNLTDVQKKTVSDILLRHQRARNRFESDLRTEEIEVNSLIEGQIDLPEISTRLKTIESIRTEICMGAITDTRAIINALTPAQRERWPKVIASLADSENGKKEQCSKCKTPVTICLGTAESESTEKCK